MHFIRLGPLPAKRPRGRVLLLRRLGEDDPAQRDQAVQLVEHADAVEHRYGLAVRDYGLVGRLGGEDAAAAVLREEEGFPGELVGGFEGCFFEGVVFAEGAAEGVLRLRGGLGVGAGVGVEDFWERVLQRHEEEEDGY